MLTAYQTATEWLLHDPNNYLFPLPNLTTNINTARSQVALESEATQFPITQSASATQKLSNLSVSGIAGATSVAVVRAIVSASGLLDFRPWEWFFAYYLAGAGTSGPPTIWSQSGAGNTGVIYFNLTSSVSLTFDCILLPGVLVDDTTPELIPYPWTDAVPYYTAYLCFLNAQRNQDAETMYQLYERQMLRARQIMTASELVGNRAGVVGTHMARDMAGSLTIPLPAKKG